MPSNRRRSRLDRLSGFSVIIMAVLIFAIIVVCYSCAYNSIESDCVKRGGHMEHVISTTGRGGSVCEGATS